MTLPAVTDLCNLTNRSTVMISKTDDEGEPEEAACRWACRPEPLLDIMRRSMANLAFVEAHAGPSGPYEVTQLINTFLGALTHPLRL